MSKESKESDLTWPTERMAKWLDVTPQYLGVLVRKGIVSKLSHGRFDPFAVVPAYIRWLRDQRAKLGDTEETKIARDAKDARHQMQIDEAAMVKHDRDLQESKLVYRVAVRDRLIDVMSKMRQVIEGFRLGEKREEEIFKVMREMEFDPPKVVGFKP